MGPRIYAAQGLPVLGEDGKIPDGLVEQYGTKICPADGFASVFPEHKYLIVETLRQAGFRCGMTGDGVNDAPALKRADVGIAVQGATDAARAAADLVLTGEGLSVIIDGIEVARETFARLKNFISYRIAATLQLLLFFFIALFAFPPETYYNKYGFKMETGNYKGEYIQVPRMSTYCPGGVAYLCLCPVSISVACLCLLAPKPLSLSCLWHLSVSLYLVSVQPNSLGLDSLSSETCLSVLLHHVLTSSDPSLLPHLRLCRRRPRQQRQSC